MSGPPRVRSANIATKMEARSVLGPAGNKVPVEPEPKSVKKREKSVHLFSEGKDGEKDKELLGLQKEPMPAPQSLTLTASILRQQERKVENLSMSLSCLSDGGASSSSAGSSSSGKTGRGGRRGVGVGVRRKQSEPKGEGGVMVVDSGEDGCLENKKRCGWVTPNPDLCYVAFHDEEWGVPVHDDKKLFELLSLSGALAELTWPTILGKRHIFRETFLEFDPRAVSKLNEFGSFDKYIWSFVNHKPIVGQFRYPRQVPVKSSKAEAVSK
ncbi:Detected protein of unknown function [Hibiscus syriacus]|uniref:DNA-3-methyladenine glycosylase I n=1 Tax=Hibiscus syriacus TaxID=106335 RepID=A0A6A2XKF9_HIBSY|nr:Detected protein of unknown function [Hibiscus syriacus]